MGKISFTMDLWTDLDLRAYMAITAHWLEQISPHRSGRVQQSINLRTDLIGFVHIPGSHTGERLASIFLVIIDRLKLAQKVFLFL
jgi:hypothetical protein